MVFKGASYYCVWGPPKMRTYVMLRHFMQCPPSIAQKLQLQKQIKIATLATIDCQIKKETDKESYNKQSYKESDKQTDQN